LNFDDIALLILLNEDLPKACPCEFDLVPFSQLPASLGKLATLVSHLVVDVVVAYGDLTSGCHHCQLGLRGGELDEHLLVLELETVNDGVRVDLMSQYFLGEGD